MDATDRLKIFDLCPDAVLATVEQMLLRGTKQVLQRHGRNNSILPAIVQLDNEVRHLSLTARLSETTKLDGLSHCWALCGGKNTTLAWLLQEAGTEQHPRLVVESAGGGTRFRLIT